ATAASARSVRPRAPRRSTAEVIDEIRQHNALDMIGDPEDIGWAMVYLASDESRYMSGQTLVLDGGLTAQSPIAASRRVLLDR
ncbi:SDR family oxidoreductase, partial [Streptomyces sp. NPDC018347]|uniref:SDR family oxidoreductase n=1 Tax=Streptomyces sp. NPDC018347 TaxID=3157193 RepID=UPI0033D1EA60